MSMIIFMNSRRQYFIFLLIALHRILANSEPGRYKSRVFLYSKIGLMCFRLHSGFNLGWRPIR
jgi:hypothetical protein